MKYWGGWSFFEAYNLPVVMRRWFLKRLFDQKKKEAEAHNEAVQAAKSKNRR